MTQIKLDTTHLALLVIVCLVNHQSGRFNVAADEKPDLYSDVDDVLRLTSNNFDSTVFGENKNVTHMVQFYNTFCGHCQMFAPVYKQLATRVRNWTSVVQVAGVDCSKDENVITCSDNNVLGYPTLVIFPPNAKKNESKDEPLNLRSLPIEWTIDDIEDSIVDYLYNLTKTERRYPKAIDALVPIEVGDLRDVKRLYPSKSEHDLAINERHNIQDFMLVIESDKSYLGRKLIIEYFRISSRLELRRVLLSNTELIQSLLTEKDLSKLNDTQPILVRLKGDFSDGKQKGQVLVRGEVNSILPTSDDAERQDFISDRFRMFFEHYYSVELKEMDQNEGKTRGETLQKPRMETNEVSSKHGETLEIQYLVHSDPIGSRKVFAIDLLKAMTYMITHEVKIKGDLTPAEFGTVRNLLTIIKKYLPLERWDSSFSKFIDEFRTRLDNERSRFEKDGIRAQELRDLLEVTGSDAIRLRYNRENWVSCFDSDRQHKGYTCSLWLLFHSLTVGEYVKSAPVKIRPTMVLFTMRDYIINFLGCSVCSSNFAKETESLEDSLIGRNSSALWLWNTHNLVNQRLNNEKHDAKKHLAQVIFPTHDKCPRCLITDLSEVGMDGKTYQDVLWNLPEVFAFLLDTYRPDHIVTPIEMASLISRIKGKVNYDLIDLGVDGHPKRLTAPDMNRSVEQWNIQSIFSTGDMSICLFLYVSCIVMVAVVCVALNPKWKRYKSKQ